MQNGAPHLIDLEVRRRRFEEDQTASLSNRTPP